MAGLNQDTIAHDPAYVRYNSLSPIGESTPYLYLPSPRCAAQGSTIDTGGR
ncbi:hypothetical protein MMC07_008576 [Pseudocyphellaria aurata]|nr:hypothetical protein [Pseudocyphellaria aurata]